MNGLAFYNEIDPFAADWLEQLIAAGSICPGVVDRRDIRDILPSNLDGYAQVHFFAGIGGWSYALRLAGWPDDRPVWTGSCPCQPFSAAGRGGGFADERHLWPAFFHLISERRPATVFGEQVASKDGLAWFDLVHADLEGAGYAVGAADLCAAGVGAPHIRQRLWFVADAAHERHERIGPPWGWRNGSSDGRDDVDLGNNSSERCGKARTASLNPRSAEVPPSSGHWDSVEWLSCRDGKARPTQPGLQPLLDGVPNRVGTLRGAGNAIVPIAGAAFIVSAMNASPPSLSIVEAAE